MSARLTILASGSAGNCALVDCDGVSWLIDLGLEPNDLDARLAEAGASWSHIAGVLITHRHSDHWRPKSLARCWTSRVPVHCHRDHAPAFRVGCPEFDDLERGRLVKPYVGERPIALSPNWHCHPIRVRHDSGATFGFRFEESRDSGADPTLSVCDPPPQAFAYVADLGCWDRGLVERLMDVDLLALEFNHDPELVRNSSRPPWLIQRILGDEGHLSNAQAAALITALLKQGRPERLRQLVLLHLSQECNSSALATASARAALTKSGSNASIFSAEQNQASPTFIVGEARPSNDVVQLVQASLF